MKRMVNTSFFREVKHLLSQGWTGTDVARRLGCSLSLISKIRSSSTIEDYFAISAKWRAKAQREAQIESDFRKHPEAFVNAAPHLKSAGNPRPTPRLVTLGEGKNIDERLGFSEKKIDDLDYLVWKFFARDTAGDTVSVKQVQQFVASTATTPEELLYLSWYAFSRFLEMEDSE